MVYSKKIVCSFLYPYKDKIPVLGIYGKCMTQTKIMNHPLFIQVLKRLILKHVYI